MSRELPVNPWQSVNPTVLEPTRQVPTMLSPEEQLLYYWITSQWAKGCGAIVELGCFVGGSTARLAEGHRVAGLNSQIHAYDRFLASETAKKNHLYSAGIPPFDGEDILPLAKSLLTPWADRIELHPGMIEDQPWTGGDIEVLVMDASKSTEASDHMAAKFFPHLIAGKSLVVQQDYLHWKQPWIAVQMERMANWFTPVAKAPKDTVVFRCDAKIDAAALNAGKVDGLPQDAMMAALHAARARLRTLKTARKLNRLIDAARDNPTAKRAMDMKSKKPAKGQP